MEVAPVKYSGKYDSKRGMFGMTRLDEFAKPKPHGGVDLLSNFGAKVFSPVTGKVSRIDYENPKQKNKGLGYRVEIEFIYQNEKSYVSFGHLDASNTAGLKKGSLVTPGTHIGNVGKTGNSTKRLGDGNNLPHVHVQFYRYKKTGETKADNNSNKIVGKNLTFLNPNLILRTKFNPDGSIIKSTDCF
jgi:murein DD-endopeptidase MepM/ murein hydrolase activator NlpD